MHHKHESTSDNTYPQTPNGEYVTLIIALQDHDVENGCLYIYPGSHKEGIFPFEPTKSYREDPKSNPGNTVDLEILKKFEPKTNLEIKKVVHFLCKETVFTAHTLITQTDHASFYQLAIFRRVLSLFEEKMPIEWKFHLIK